ncbi:MAG TPA: hypothetical protein VII23_24695 [Terriglobales bacterium]
MDFLADRELRPVASAEADGLRVEGLLLGNGAGALEILVTTSSVKPSVQGLRAAWKARVAGRATPVLLVSLYDGKAALIGPSGDHPWTYTDLEFGRVERICAAALDEPDRHTALRFLNNVLSELESHSSGLRNEGLFASHELEAGVPERGDWIEARNAATPLLKLRERDLLTGLGFTIEALPGAAYVLRAADSRVAVAVLLERDEVPEIGSSRFSNLSPISYALARADAENLDYVIMLTGPAIRLYPVRVGVGTGQRGRSETYAEIRLDLLPEDQASYLWLLFSAAALRKNGTVHQILETSARYAADLGSRLRDRIYNEVVPPLAQGLMVARNLRSPIAKDLADTYEMALVILFRLLFVAYAEDKELLPYKTNEFYRDRSLKKKANDLTTMLREQRHFGEATTAHWEDVERLFRAVDQGNTEWGVPKYNGGLFSSDPSVSPIGAAIARVRLRDHVFGPVLAALLVDRTPEGWGAVDFRSLGVREFGTVYEGLLENELSIAEADLTTEVKDKQERYRPAKTKDKVVVRQGQAFLHDTSGARKSTGSYFTKHFAVEYLLERGLDPAIKDHLNRLDELSVREAGEAFFDFRIVDITMGSGHFLVAALDRIELGFSRYLANRPLPIVLDELLRLSGAAGETLEANGATIEFERLLRRQIARRCIYGVDINPIAVELARLALWVHTFVPGLPLSFLDHSLVIGNALVGIATVDEARDVLRDALDQPLLDVSSDALIGHSADPLQRLARLSDANAQEIAKAREAFRDARKAVSGAESLFDVLTACRMSADLRESLLKYAMEGEFEAHKVVSTELHDQARQELASLTAFHFPVAFPEVFLRKRPGFEVIVGNPPWEKVRVEEHEFWARHHPGLRGLGKAERDKLISHLRKSRPDLVVVWEHERDATEKLRDAIRFFPGMNTGHPDLFRAFVWRFIQLVSSDKGRIAVVLPGDAFKIAGGKNVRECLVAAVSRFSPQMLTNKGQWVFDDVHPQKLITLVTAVVEETEDTIIELSPEFHDRARWDRTFSETSDGE